MVSKSSLCPYVMRRIETKLEREQFSHYLMQCYGMLWLWKPQKHLLVSTVGCVPTLANSTGAVPFPRLCLLFLNRAGHAQTPPSHTLICQHRHFNSHHYGQKTLSGATIKERILSTKGSNSYISSFLKTQINNKLCPRRKT